MRRPYLAWSLAAALALSAVARADEGRGGAAEARSLFLAGVEAAEDGRWSDAALLFQRSGSLYPRASTAYNLGRALEHLGRRAGAIEAFEAFLRLSDRHRDARLRREVADRIARDRGPSSSPDPRTVTSSVAAEPPLQRTAEPPILPEQPGPEGRAGASAAGTDGPDGPAAPGGAASDPATAPAPSSGLLASPWLWIGVGLGVVAAGVAAGVVLGGRERAAYGGSAGVVLRGLGGS